MILAPELQESTLVACQLAIRDWIIDQYGQPDVPASVEFWKRNVLFCDRERMADEGTMGAAMGVACEPGHDWTNWCSSALGDEWYRQGIFLEPFNHWLLSLYLRSDV